MMNGDTKEKQKKICAELNRLNVTLTDKTRQDTQSSQSVSGAIVVLSSVTQCLKINSQVV